MEGSVGLFNAGYQAMVVVADTAFNQALAQERRRGSNRQAAKDHLAVAPVFRTVVFVPLQGFAENFQILVGADNLDTVLGEEPGGSLGDVDAAASAKDRNHVNAVALSEIEFPKFGSGPFYLGGDVKIGQVQVLVQQAGSIFGLFLA